MSASDETYPAMETVPDELTDDDLLDDEELVALPPKRRRLPFATALLALCVAGGIGVVGGVLIEKHWGGGSSAGTAGSIGGARAAGLTTANGRSGAAQTGGGSAAGAFGRSGTAGQVKAIDGTTLYVTDLQGNTIKVTTVKGVRVQVMKGGTLKSVMPGDYVVVQGTKTKAGYQATSITDNGKNAGSGQAFGAGGVGGNPPGSTTTTGTSSGQPALPGLG